MTHPPLALVDLRRQYESIKTEIDAAVARVLGSGNYVLTEDVSAFEREWADHCGVSHCVGVASGTAALALAYQAIGVSADDEVIVPVNTFAATLLPLLKLGARPILVDCDHYGLLDVALAEQAITTRTKAIVGVDLYGHPCDGDAIAHICQEHGLTFVEDASQAHGATYKSRRCGSLAHVAAFSFYPTKNLGAYGEAGAVLTHDRELAGRMSVLRNVGQRRKYEHTLVGDNYRLDGIQAAILRVKLDHLDRWVTARRRHARRYTELLTGVVSTPEVAEWAQPSWHIYAVRTPHRDSLQAALEGAGIATAIHYPVPLHLQPVLKQLGYAAGDFPVAEDRARTLLSLPMFPELLESEVARVAEVVERHLAALGPAG